MKISVSNIAWPAELDDAAFAILHQHKIRALEIAPPRIWPQWQGSTRAAAAECRQMLESHGFTISSFQAILFGKPDCVLFGSDTQRQCMLEHLNMCADLARQMGARYLVFGAPKNREPKALCKTDAFRIAAEFFRLAGDYFHRQGVFLCLEPNPADYGCGFVVTSTEAAELIRAVDSPGFRLHLDTGCMHLAREDAATAIRRNFDVLHHFHASEPFLSAFTDPLVDHRRVAEELHSLGYKNWVTLEMRATDRPLADVSTAVNYLVQTYLGITVN